MSPHSTRTEQLLSTVVLGLLLVGCFFVLRPFLAAVMWAAILAISAQPLFAWLTRSLGGRRTVAAGLLTLVLAATLLVPVLIVGASLAGNAEELMQRLSRFAAEGLPDPPAWVAGLPVIGETLDGYLRGMAHDTRALTEEGFQLLRPLLGKLPAVGAALGQGVIDLALSVLIAFFLFRDGDPIRRKIDTVALRLGGQQGRRMIDVGQATIVGVVYGIIGTALAQGMLAGLGLALAGVPAAPLLGLLTFFLSVVPVGPPLVWAPSAFWLWSNGQTAWAIFVFLWGLLVVSSVDNLLKPLLISRGSRLPFILVLLGVLGGVITFGFVGVFLGPTLLAVGYRLLQEWAPEPRPSVRADGTPSVDAAQTSDTPAGVGKEPTVPG